MIIVILTIIMIVVTVILIVITTASKSILSLPFQSTASAPWFDEQHLGMHQVEAPLNPKPSNCRLRAQGSGGEGFRV